MPTQNVNLTQELESFVKKQIAEGTYQSASEVHRAALTSMARQEEQRRLQLEKLRIEVQKGLDDFEAGRVIPVKGEEGLKAMFDDSLERAMQRLDAENAEIVE